MWHFSSCGVYTVNSRYEFALRLKRWGTGHSSTGGESSMREDDKNLWKHKVWGLPIPNKIKYFIWKCINGILPIRENLFRRRVTREMLLCINCKGNCETFPHLFLECQFWKSSPVGFCVEYEWSSIYFSLV